MTDATGRVISPGDIVYYQPHRADCGTYPPERLIVDEKFNDRPDDRLVAVRHPSNRDRIALISSSDLWPSARQAADARVEEARADLAAWQRHAISISAGGDQ